MAKQRLFENQRAMESGSISIRSREVRRTRRPRSYMDSHWNVHLLCQCEVRLKPLVAWLNTLILDPDFAKNSESAALEHTLHVAH